jgi:hypothetical protein
LTPATGSCCWCVTEPGGIVLKREALDIEAWLEDLTAAVAAQAQRSERARQALQRLIIDQ